MNYRVDLPVSEPWNSLVWEAKDEGLCDGFLFIKIYSSLAGICFKLSCVRKHLDGFSSCRQGGGNKYLCSLFKWSVSHLFFFFWFFFRAAPAAYGSFQARGWIGAAAASLCHRHSKSQLGVCSLQGSSLQCLIFNPLHEARDGICVLMDTGQVPCLLSHNRSSGFSSLKDISA